MGHVGCGQHPPLFFDITVKPEFEFRHALLIMSADITNSKSPFFVCLNKPDDCDVVFLCCRSPTLRAIKWLSLRPAQAIRNQLITNLVVCVIKIIS